jgi:hypothetical protein
MLNHPVHSGPKFGSASEGQSHKVTEPMQTSIQKGVWQADLPENMNDESFTSLLDRDASYTELMRRVGRNFARGMI